MSRLATGAISLLGKVNHVNPPHLVMPLTVEPSKPRLCNDNRFLNLWIKDSPFTLDSLSTLPRYVIIPAGTLFSLYVMTSLAMTTFFLSQIVAHTLVFSGPDVIPFLLDGNLLRTFTIQLNYYPHTTFDLSTFPAR